MDVDHHDAGGLDARPADAAPDAATTAELHIKVDGRGATTLASGDTCNDTAPGHECVFIVRLGLAIEIRATPDDDFMFDKWTAGPCLGATTSTCAFVFTAPTYVGARFRK